MIEATLRQRSPKTILAMVAALALLPFLLVEAFRTELYTVMDTASYLVFHNIAEFFSVMVSLSIFGVGWYTYEQSKDRHALFLSAAFLAIGLMDFMRTLGYAGMPAFITPNSANKSTQFWIAVRLFTASAFLVSAWVYPDRPSPWLTKVKLMTGAISISGLVFIAVTFFPSSLPATFIEGVGLTPFKKISEYAVIGLLLAASAAYWKRMSQTRDRRLIYYIAAFVLCIFSEFVFAIYKSVFDTFNVLGHSYKVIAFCLIYWGVFITSVKHPYIILRDASEKLTIEINGRKQVEGKIIKAKEEWERTFDAITDPIIIVNTDYRIIRANKAMADKLGVAPQEVIGLTCYRALHDTNRPSPSCPHVQLLADGRPHSAEMREEHLDGDYVISVSPLFDEKGTLYGSVHYVRDITKRKRTEEMLRESEKRYRRLVESVTSYIYTVTIQDGRPVATTHGSACVSVTGYNSEEYIADPYLWYRMVHEEDRDLVVKQASTVLVGKTTSSLEHRIYHKDGLIRWVRNTMVPKFDEQGRLVAYDGLVTDITERKMAEEAVKRYSEELEEKVGERTKELEKSKREIEDAMMLAEAASRAKSDFLSNMSHELRTPLNSILGFSAILQDGLYGPINEKQKEYVDNIYSSGRHLLSLINDILDLSKVESGKFELDLSTVSLEKVLQGAIMMMKDKAMEHGIKLVLDVETDTNIEINTDERKLKQIMFNLLGNAVKFTPEGGSVSLRARLTRDEGRETNEKGRGMKDEGRRTREEKEESSERPDERRE